MPVALQGHLVLAPVGKGLRPVQWAHIQHRAPPGSYSPLPFHHHLSSGGLQPPSRAPQLLGVLRPPLRAPQFLGVLQPPFPSAVSASVLPALSSAAPQTPPQGLSSLACLASWLLAFGTLSLLLVSPHFLPSLGNHPHHPPRATLLSRHPSGL